MSQLLSNLPVGALVRDPSSKYLGVAIVWKIADHNHAGYPTNSTTLIANNILTARMVDAKEASNTDRLRQLNGNNRYKFSNLRQWLNSTAFASAWYTAQHVADAPPTDANEFRGKVFGYYDDAGFMSLLSTGFINNVFDTTYSVDVPIVDGGGTERLTDKIFLISVDEVGLGSGGAFPIFTDDASRIGYYTSEGEAWHNEEAIKGGYTLVHKNKAHIWLLRTVDALKSCNVRGIDRMGLLYGFDISASLGNIGVRPLCNMNSSVLVSDDPDMSGIYDINFAPYISGSDIVQGFIYGGFNYEYSVADNTEGDTVTAVECIDGTQIKSYIVTLGQTNQFGLSREAWLALDYGDHTATIRVTDTENQSETRTITFTKHQAAPTISGSDGSLGHIVGSLTYSYTVDDLNSIDGDTVTVVEELDGVQKRSYTAELGVQTEFNIIAEDWDDIAYGNHTIVITATDSYGLTATRTETFVKRNNMPAISGSDMDLGNKETDFTYNYTVYDDNFIEGDIVTVVEKVNGTETRTYMLQEQKVEEFSITGVAFLSLLNAEHTLTITATDTKGESVTRTIIFTKQQNISVTLAQALPNDNNKSACPVQAVVTLDAYIPTGATISVEICNNGFDDNPTWENCTIEAVNNRSYTFRNNTKTAENWGVNVRVAIKRNGSEGRPEIKALFLKFKY